MRNTLVSALLGLFLATGAAAAAEPHEHGEETRRWLEIQRDGQAASPHRQTVSGPAAQMIHKRYLESFRHPVPVFFEERKQKTTP